jgi:hypothetical protein
MLFVSKIISADGRRFDFFSIISGTGSGIGSGTISGFGSV